MDINEILGQLPVDQIAGQLGVDRGEAAQAVELALPALLGGMEANARDEAGASSLVNALGQHDDGLIDAVASGDRRIDEVDTDDGGKIVSHVFGDQQDQVVSKLGAAGGGKDGLIAQLLPILAPIVMSYLAKKVMGGGSGGGAPSGGGGGIDLGGILGQVLGGGSSGGSSGAGSAGGIDLGGLLGGLLGGGRR